MGMLLLKADLFIAREKKYKTTVQKQETQDNS